MSPEAPLSDGPGGRQPAGAGWFVVNVADAAWFTHPKFGSATRFEGPQAPFAELGLNLRVVMPGQPNGYYHGESHDEHFLVLQGECDVIVEGETRRLRAWDFVHFPPMTPHICVGAGDGPCVVLMAGTRTPEEDLVYPRDETALAAGAGVETETDSAAEAYAGLGRPEPGRPEQWDQLPWARR